jgi:hypothetical protein
MYVKTLQAEDWNAWRELLDFLQIPESKANVIVFKNPETHALARTIILPAPGSNISVLGAIKCEEEPPDDVKLPGKRD